MSVTRNTDLPVHSYGSGAHYGELPLAALPAGDATGDIFYYSGTNWTIVPLNTVAGSGSSAGMTNPMVDVGDMIIGGTGGSPVALPVGLTNQVLTVVSGVPFWDDAQNVAVEISLCTAAVIDIFGADADLGDATSTDGTNYLSDFPAWAGDREERVELLIAAAVPSGNSIVVWTETNIDANTAGPYAKQVYDQQGNTWVLDSTSTAQGSGDIIAQIWHCNVTNPLSAGDYIRFALNVGSSLLASDESGRRTIGAYSFNSTLSGATVGTEANGFSSSPAIASSATGGLTVVGALMNGGATPSGDADWTTAFVNLRGGDDGALIGSYLIPGANQSYNVVGGSGDWTITSVAYSTSSQVVTNDGRDVLVGSATTAKRCDDTEHYHTTTDPTSSDDWATGAWRENTLWVNESTGAAFILTDKDAGTWVQITGGNVAAADVTIADAGGYFTGTDVEAALQEIGADLAGIGSHGTIPVTASLSNPPTESELETAIGSPSDSAGLAYILTDSDSGLQYLAISDGVKFTVVPVVTQPTDGPLSLTSAPSGGWSNNGRVNATYYNGKTYIAYTDGTNGNKCIRSYDHATGTISAETVLKAALSDDPVHSEPTVVVRASDHKIVVIYSVSGGAALYQRVSTNPEDISAFDAETNIDSQIGGSAYTYPHLMELADALYLFVQIERGPGGIVTGQKWGYSTSTDGGATWATATEFFTEASAIGYIASTKTSESRVDFSAVSIPSGGTPPTHLYHAYFDGTAFYETSGGTITAPFGVSSMTKAWDATADNALSSVVPVMLRDGQPTILNSAIFGDATIHALYHYWDGSTWTTVELADDIDDATAGGGAGANLIGPNIAYLSRNVAGTNQIWRYVQASDRIWTSAQITSGSTDKVRPIRVLDGAPDLTVLWLEGDSSAPPDFSCGIAGFGMGSADASDTEHLTRIVSIDGDKADLEALTGPRTEVLVGVADDTGEIGVYKGGAWHWGTGADRRILLADGHATPFTFNDLLQMDDGSDFMWSD